jgi:hemerythrin
MMVVTDELVEQLEEGVETINEQHRRIFDFTTDLFAHCIGEEAEENEYFGAVIEEAAALIITHFRTEEELMLATKFDVFEYAAHKKEHDDFVAGVTDYINKFHASGAVNLLMFASYAKWWVIGHIKRYDSKYINYFNQITANHGIEQMRA